MEELRVVKSEKGEEEEEDFRSCCEDEDELNQREDSDLILDEFSVKLYFKGVSVACPGDSGLRVSGIGVVMENRGGESPIQVQKKLDFYVEDLVADYLALLDGLSLAIQNNMSRVFAFTDSEFLYNQIMHDDSVKSPLLEALRLRILEQASKIKSFVLKFVHCSKDLHKAISLAHVAVGIVSFADVVEESTETCSICCEEKLSSMMFTTKCSHKFCSHCMTMYIEGKLQSSAQVPMPIRCPQLNCKCPISAVECRSFLPVSSYESLEKALLEANVLNSSKMYCPYPNCSVLLDPHEYAFTRASSSVQPENSCVECLVCRRPVCVDCGVPWHCSMTCEEYRNTPLDERDLTDLTLHRLAQDRRWKRCRQCRRMIELTDGCYHMRCWCGHEFCYSCGREYLDGQQTCDCDFWDDDYPHEEAPAQQLEQWAWDSFESLPMMMDAYSDQERSQLALIQSFLAGGFGNLSDQNVYQSPSPPDSYADAMKDLHQLPWLERFVSVISDNYYEDYVQ